MKRKKMKHKFFYIIIILIIGLNIYTLFFLRSRYNNEKHNKELMHDIEQYINPNDIYDDKYQFMNIEFSKLKQKNEDTVSYLVVDGSEISYPVVQTKDNKYYLNHSFDKKENNAGWVFMDYRNNANSLDKNTIIYGHNRLTGTMFGTLKELLEDSYYQKDTHYIYLYTENNNYVFEVFSVYTIQKETYYLKTGFTSDKEYEKFLTILQNRSTYSFPTTVTNQDKIITLSTCSGNNDRTVVHAKLIYEEKRTE